MVDNLKKIIRRDPIEEFISKRELAQRTQNGVLGTHNNPYVLEDQLGDLLGTIPQQENIPAPVGGIATFKLVGLDKVFANRLVLADKNIVAAYPAFGIAIETVTSSVPVAVVTLGLVVNPAWSFTTGQPVYIGNSGEMTQGITSTGLLQRVGLVIEPTKVYIKIDLQYISRGG